MILHRWTTLELSVEQNLFNDMTLDGMVINKEGAFGPCILWEDEIQKRALVKSIYIISAVVEIRCLC